MDFICVNVAILKLDKFSHFGCFGSNSFTLIRVAPGERIKSSEKESYITIVVEGNVIYLLVIVIFCPKL